VPACMVVLKINCMTKKENKGGNLRNEDVEKELRIRGGSRKTGGGYEGLQDTGDDVVRGYGTEVQRREGLPPEERQEEQPEGNRDPG
jgi:hypothetical protein